MQDRHSELSRIRKTLVSLGQDSNRNVLLQAALAIANDGNSGYDEMDDFLASLTGYRPNENGKGALGECSTKHAGTKVSGELDGPRQLENKWCCFSYQVTTPVLDIWVGHSFEGVP
jgi:hypothetical protein